MQITHQAYGKSNVRLSHITRTGDTHTFIQLTLSISLSGEFDAAYIDGDNRQVIPTDTIKNSVYALASDHGIGSIERFSQLLSKHFINSFDHVAHVEISAREQLWRRIDLDGEAHGHAFTGGGSEENTCIVKATPAATTLHSGLAGLVVLKTTESGFVGFIKDQFTTLNETEDRIFATTISASWPCADLAGDWSWHRARIRAALLDVFAHRYSPSVQRTLHEMADAAFSVCNAIDEVSIEMPNQHHLLANLGPFDRENPNEVFVPTGEPFGMIAATVKRDD